MQRKLAPFLRGVLLPTFSVKPGELEESPKSKL